jgi:hypothetical protein
MEKASSASVATIVGVELTGQHGLFMEGMHVTNDPAPSCIVRIILAPMGPGTLRKYAGLPMKDSPLFCHTVPEIDPTTTAASSYGFLLPGNDTGVRRQLSHPRLLTKYQPIDRGR